MANSLGLDDDMDSVEVIQDLERAFDIQFANDEVTHLLTVGELYDLIASKIPANEADKKCATAMAFYRLRSACERLGYGAGLVPASNLSFLTQGKVRFNLQRLEKESGLHLPKAQQTNFGCFGAFAGFVIVWIATFYIRPGILSGVIGFFAGGTAAGMVLKHVDPGQFPRDCHTFADLTRRTAVLSYGFLIKAGAKHSEDDIWDALLEVLSVWMLPKSEITRDTLLLQSQLKKSASAA